LAQRAGNAPAEGREMSNGSTDLFPKGRSLNPIEVLTVAAGLAAVGYFVDGAHVLLVAAAYVTVCSLYNLYVARSRISAALVLVSVILALAAYWA
jgi:hypothetical protein